MHHALSNFLRWFVACFCVLLAMACEEFPRDARGSLDAVLETGVLEVGLLHAPPWVDTSTPGAPRGLEVALLQAFADELGVRVQWRADGTEASFEALARGDLHILAGGLTGGNPFKAQAGFSLPYFITVRERALLDKRYKHVFAVPRGENALVMRLERFLLERIGREEMMHMAAREGIR